MSQDPKSAGYAVVEGWGKLPPGYHYLEAAGVAVDSKDNVYVFTRGEHPVIVFDRDGNFLRSWGEGLFGRAHAVTIGPDDEVWLTDDGNHTIRKFTPEGKLLLTIGDPDKPATLQSGKPFNRPTHVALCSRTGEIYISDGYGNSRVHKHDPRGRHLFSWGEPGTDPGCFNLPHNIATDAEGLVYVADRENHRIQIFDEEGRYLDQWNNLHRPCGLFADSRNRRVYVGELGTGLAINKAVPNLGNRISILSMQGELVGRVGDRFAGEGPGQFVAPHGVTLNSRGDLYVAEVSYTIKGRHENPPREIRCFQKFARTGQ
jgi:DNA-binding beta-propeller fold protein YncE